MLWETDGEMELKGKELARENSARQKSASNRHMSPGEAVNNSKEQNNTERALLREKEARRVTQTGPAPPIRAGLPSRRSHGGGSSNRPHFGTPVRNCDSEIVTASFLHPHKVRSCDLASPQSTLRQGFIPPASATNSPPPSLSHHHNKFSINRSK